MVTSSPDATMKSTQRSKHLEQTKASAAQGGRVTRSTPQVLKELNYTIPKIDSASDIKSSSKDYDSTKKDDGDEKPKVEIDERFKIPQGTSYCNKKKLEADDHRMIIARILARDLDLSGHLIDMVKIGHRSKPYGLNES